ncbi:hypothetical protein D4764_10G0011170 [Takifugu flavidus]|uniref:Reverse transcriptase zinc-binding domain-containing protein n=1 Tax=Takifugu flavidus TaxID=433684 RepID=A0A5C6PNY9_9TELE|nr:hypothetical protein D4764_10G0011170 [Takifugu flavidus]
MSFKPTKSRSMVLKKGKVVDKLRFVISGTAIQSITVQPVKSLGKLFDSSLKDTATIQKSTEELGGWLTKVDNSALPGRFKAWIYQYSILPRVLWPLLVYAVPVTTVESFERKISSFLRRWLGLPRSLNSAALYGTSNSLQLPFSGLTEEFKVARTREALQYRDSRDYNPKSAMPGAKRETTYFRRRSEQAWRKSEWVGQWDSGSWGHGQVYDALPSPANLHAWGKSETPTCSLCSGRGSLEHLLSSCPKSLADSRYRWRHDQVLKAVAESIALAISTTKHHHAPKKAISFIKAGERPRAGPQITTGLLHTAPDWQLHVDLGKQLIFPQHIVTTSLRPDMIIISEASKYLIMLELTVPWEERIEGANERKRAKYQELVEECRGRGWRTFYEPIEVGCRGFAGRSLCKVFGRIGSHRDSQKEGH